MTKFSEAVDASTKSLALKVTSDTKKYNVNASRTNEKIDVNGVCNDELEFLAIT
tara:strand:- start:248 stop:409 length:162 start_codon:yes stop_codon:yes gene_type:complete